MQAHGVHEIARTLSADWHSPVAEKVKLVGSLGAMWILRLAKSLCAATLETGTKNWNCVVCR
jgi:hypothetical protein